MQDFSGFRVEKIVREVIVAGSQDLIWEDLAEIIDAFALEGLLLFDFELGGPLDVEDAALLQSENVAGAVHDLHAVDLLREKVVSFLLNQQNFALSSISLSPQVVPGNRPVLTTSEESCLVLL